MAAAPLPVSSAKGKKSVPNKPPKRNFFRGQIMCRDEGNPRAPLSFAQLVGLFQEPRFEPCQSETEKMAKRERTSNLETPVSNGFGNLLNIG
jgi:hypothetical protein